MELVIRIGMDRSSILREAWRLARTIASTSGRPAREHLAEAQRDAWRAVRAEAAPIGALQALAEAVDAALGVHAVRTVAGLPGARAALADAVERAIGILDVLDAATEELEEESDLEDGADDEDGADAEVVDEDGDDLDFGEVDGWRRPRRARVLHTEWPVALAERERGRAVVISAVATSSNVVRFPGGRHG